MPAVRSASVVALLLALAGGGACATPRPAMSDSSATPAARTAAAPAADAPAAAPNTLTDAERAAGWRLLFDGRTTAGWRGFRQPGVPGVWRVEDGMLVRAATPASGPRPSGGDLVTEGEFGDFELALEWRVAPGGNSGIMYRVAETVPNAYESGPEMQVLDDARHADGRSPLTSAGACYGLYPAVPGVVRPAGAWNQVRLVVRGAEVEHWLNGTRVVAYALGSDDWRRRVAASKFAEWPAYGQAARGRLLLQDHGDQVAYRSIRLREL